ncbi:MAG: cell division suppressor protein YneA [Bacillota bacterium]
MRSLKKKSFVFAAVLVISLICIFLLVPTTSSGDNTYYREVVVRSGDTLWSIARDIYGYDTDIRKVIFEIVEINEMNNTDIKPGDRIEVPIKSS